MSNINSPEAVKAIVGEPNELVKMKIYDHLNERMVDFIRQSPLVMIASVDEQGFPTVSPKGVDVGAFQVADKHTVYIPELVGNKMAYSLNNILQNPKVGLIFIVPGTNEALRVHGECVLVEDAIEPQVDVKPNKQPLMYQKLVVENAYFHCAKAFMRANMWKPEAWQEKIKVSFGKEIAGNMQSVAEMEKDIDDFVEHGYTEDV